MKFTTWLRQNLFNQPQLLITLFLGAVLLFSHLNTNHLTNWDEAWYADISRNIATSNDWFRLTWNTQPFFDKPPLYFWVSAIAVKILGDRELSYRLPSALAALGTIYLAYLLSKLLFKKEIQAIFTSIILLTTIGFLYRARTGNLDVFLAFWLILSIYGYFKKNFLLVLGITGAFLTKGFIALLFPAIVLVRRPKILTSLLAALLIIGLWFTISYLINGSVFSTTFISHQLEKTVGNQSIWQNFSWEYLQYLRSGLKIWFILAVPSLVWSLWQLRKHPAYPIIVFVSAILVELSFFSNKSDWFIVPLYPLIALITSWGIGEGIAIIRSKFITRLVIFVLCLLSVWQLYHYRNQYFTPDVAKSEAEVARQAQALTTKSTTIYLTNYYVPTTVYYSQRRVIAVYSQQENNRAWYIYPKTAWRELVKQDALYIITTEEEWGFLEDVLPKNKFKILFQSGSKLLISNII